MNYKIETKEAFDVFGIETICSLKGEKGYLYPHQLWEQCHANGEYDKLISNVGDLPDFVPKNLCKIHAVEYYRKSEEDTFPYMLCGFVSKNSKNDRLQYIYRHINNRQTAYKQSNKGCLYF